MIGLCSPLSSNGASTNLVKPLFLRQHLDIDLVHRDRSKLHLLTVCYFEIRGNGL